MWIAMDEYRYEIQIIGRLQVCSTDYDIDIKMHHYTNRHKGGGVHLKPQ